MVMLMADFTNMIVRRPWPLELAARGVKIWNERENRETNENGWIDTFYEKSFF